LLFEGGITADLGGIRANAAPITTLATVGMILAITATGLLLHYALGLRWGPALLLGAILAVTDTVSILYAFRKAPVPPRLAGIMQGESLFNDGTALVAYAAILSVVKGSSVSLPVLGGKVLLATAGGVLVGLALGMAAGFLMQRTLDPLAEIMITTVVALASYMVAEQLHVSGAIAAVTAGLAVGHRLRTSLSPQSQVAIHSFWEYATFGVNTFLFLSVGLATQFGSLVGRWSATLLAMLCVFAGRAVAVYLPFLLMRLLRPAEAVPARWQHVFVIGNIKGALSIALALGLPASTPSRQLIIDVAFGVTFLSLVGQGLLLGRALSWLGLTRTAGLGEGMAEQQARLIAARAARHELEALHASGLVSRAGYEHLRGEYQVDIAAAERELRRLNEEHLAESARMLVETRRRLLSAERSALVAARGSGLLPETVAEEALARIDARVLELEHALHGDGGHGVAS
ncbi:MAG: cation:proton antiporter, partial [Myxococcales bacterium]